MRLHLNKNLWHFKDHQVRWPKPRFDKDEEPHFLFIVTPPYSGSTALCELINSSLETMILQERGEGQWLVPGLCEKDRWNPDKDVDYESVKAIWLARYQMVKRLTQHVSVVIEKSPPNLIRLDDLLSLFKDYSLLANNRNPYANCSSILHRNYKIDEMDDKARADALQHLASVWIERSEVMKDLIERHNIPLLTYEMFCSDPTSVIDKLNLPDGVADSINPEAVVRVKDYEIQPIKNQNEKQISKLTKQDIKIIGECLQDQGDLLQYFGYEIEGG